MAATTTTMNNEPFPFLKLPAELRLMVYANLYIKRHHTPQASSKSPSGRPIWASNLKHVTRSFPCSLLITCKLVYQEARPFLGSLQAGPTRLLIKNDDGLYLIILLFDSIISRSLGFKARVSPKLDWYNLAVADTLDTASIEIFIDRCSACISRPGHAAGSSPPEVIVFMEFNPQQKAHASRQIWFGFQDFVLLMRRSFGQRTGDLRIMWYLGPDTNEVVSCGYKEGAWYDEREMPLSGTPERVTKQQWTEDWEEEEDTLPILSEPPIRSDILKQV